MIGQTEALLKLGTTIVTFVAKKWMGDKSLSGNLAATLSQIFEIKLTGVINQRRTARQFEAIAERIAETLNPLLEIEFRSIDEASRQSVIHAVDELLQKTPLDGKLLLSYDLNPTRLERHFSQQRLSYIQHYSSNEIELFDRLISECCQYTVDLSAQLPRFSEQSLGELLARESTLMQRLETVIKTAEQIRSNINHDGPEARGHFEERYLRTVIRLLDRLELVGVDVSRESSQQQLSVAYVALSVSPRHPSNRDRGRVTDEAKSVSSVDGSSDLEAMTSVERALISSRRLVIAGLAGAGKTTLLKWIAVQVARRAQHKVLTDWTDSVPFLVQLRQLDGPRLSLPAPEAFVELLAPEISGLMPRGWVHNYLQSGSAVILVDGMDEVPEQERAAVRNWLDRLIDAYPENRYILTSRPHAIKDTDSSNGDWNRWFNRHGFVETELLPMGIAQIDALVKQWHTAVALELQDADAMNALPALAQILLKRLRADRALRSLAETPLLCAVICALHRDRRTHLPRDRVSLYEKCCELLLERRDQERAIELTDYPDLSLREKSALVEDLAYYLMKNQWSEVDTSQADRRLARTGNQLTGIKKKVPGKALRRLLVERCGLLTEPTVGRLTFAHRTFQEYLAARAAIEECDYGVLLEHAVEDTWKEVIVLAAGIAKRAEAESLIENLISIGDKRKVFRHRCYALAIACCGSARRLSPRIRDAIKRRLEQLSRPTDQDEAQAFAAAGDHAVPYLKYAQGTPKRKLASSVSTLGLIGTDAALNALEDYTQDESREIARALLNSWEEFPDRNEYARRVVCRIPKLSDEIFGYTRDRPVVSLDGFEHFTFLSTLSIAASAQLSDLGALSKLVGLTSLTLYGIDGVTQLAPLASLQGLNDLHVIGANRLSDLTPLSALETLERLSLRTCPQLKSLHPLQSLDELQELFLNELRVLPDFGPISGLTNLQHVELSSCESIDEVKKLKTISRLTIRHAWMRDLSVLSNLTQLRHLEITASSTFEDIHPISHLTNLTSLNFFNCRAIRNLTPLGQLELLEQLALPICDRSFDLSVLGQLEKLEFLHFPWVDSLPNLQPLSGNPNLRAVRISHGRTLTNLQPLRELTGLTDLSFDGCESLSDLSPLTSLPNLERLDVYRCPRIIDLQTLKDMPKLKHVNIHCFSKEQVNRVIIPDGLNVKVNLERWGP